MEISEKQFEKIKNLMSIERKPAKMSNQQFLNALLYIVENGYKWRSLPEKFGKWIYMNFNRWWKNETIQRIFEELQRQKIIDVQSKSLCLDSTIVKVHPNASGARKSSDEQSRIKNWKFEWSFSRANFHFISAEFRRDLHVKFLDPKRANNESTCSLCIPENCYKNSAFCR